jgi:hypothetical protein
MIPTMDELMAAGLSREDAETVTSSAEIAKADQARLRRIARGEHPAVPVNRQPFTIRARGNWRR